MSEAMPETMPERRLVIFDVDGTLIDSQAEIAGAMARAFAVEGIAPPDLAAVRTIVGLSLNEAVMRLLPLPDAVLAQRIVDAYRVGYRSDSRVDDPARSPLFPGARAMLDAMRADRRNLLAVATGKSRRGLDRIIALHGLDGFFFSRQTADDHPSKPDPSMIRTILSETGIAPERTVMVGDTSYDIDMGRAAGVATVAVAWGYHPAHGLRADAVITHFDALPMVVDGLLEGRG